MFDIGIDGNFPFIGKKYLSGAVPNQDGTAPVCYWIHRIYQIYPFSEMPANPVFMRVCGEFQSGSCSYSGWQLFVLWRHLFVHWVAFVRTRGAWSLFKKSSKPAVYAAFSLFWVAIVRNSYNFVINCPGLKSERRGGKVPKLHRAAKPA